VFDAVLVRIAIPVKRKDFPETVVMFIIGPAPLRVMAVRSEPVVDAPPAVALTAPAPCIVTEVLNVTDIVPVQVQAPAGMDMMSPSAGDANSLLMAACTAA
jgi:hypothetical protein